MLNADAVGLQSEPVRRSWEVDDALLYALGIGAGTGELAFTTENTRSIEPQAIPTFGIVLSTPIPQRFDGTPWLSFWERVGDIDWRNVVHGEQGLQVHRPLPIRGELTAVTEISHLWDKGSGAVIGLTTEICDARDEVRLATATASLFVKRAGGWGGDRGPSAAIPVPPGRAPDAVVTYCTYENQALLYRLSGDRNPLHTDPTVAHDAGFDRPILHGLCTFGFAARAVIAAACGADPKRLAGISGRFTAPVWPGDQLRTEMWREAGSRLRFRTLTGDARVVIDGGAADIA